MDDRLNYAPCGYISITHEGVISAVNETFLHKMGYKLEELVNKHIESIMSTANKLIFHSYFYPYINLDGQVDELFIRLMDREGSSVAYLLNGRCCEVAGEQMIDCILVPMGKRIHYEMELRTAKRQIEEAYRESDQALIKLKLIHAEIEQKQAELMEMNAILVELSVTDKLTGLRNRRFFQEKLEEQLRLYEETRRSFSLLIVDIDYFKKVNDTYGHPMGDYVLEKLANILKLHARKEDIPARYGGEEFVVILPDTGMEEARSIAESMRLAVAEAVWEIGTVTISVGIATTIPGDTEAALLQRADQALYASKENGRNRVTHSSELDE
ncbi:diguanylate cyclase [Paenibacillaceae bacterium]|nr:diguanylate cyclase [Paenibacillaceae bacterium]